MNDKKLVSFLHYYTSGGIQNEKDYQGMHLYLRAKYILEVDVTCTLSISIGSISFQKEFSLRQYPFLKERIDELNQLDLSTLKSYSNTKGTSDLSTNHLEYAYENEDEVYLIDDFEHSKLLPWLNALQEKLLKDDQVQTLIQAIINSDQSFNFPKAKELISK